ncbi:hypothetical protein BI49514_03027 [Brevibacterium iodinum ATCC 49514]|uniref:DUF4439 domain-containing protein n=1 Tax=Brevibacterium iodinum ATCC 49514 TaxID=1255616 RepID=A0A2H1KGV1_9MICO|nr:hypothetical protein [Brevibacterium iodinum]SMX98798.1 hypothetical protein BI49514_03027 [Brevibacterium iodinum ATCC 49514]SUW13006.1 Uncharacterised protein [Brevibacterium iodinum]
MHSPVSRRGLLTAGVGGLSLGLLTACGLRLDQDPEIPTLDATQQLRNRLARILDSTSPGAGDPETAGENLADFAAAIGPEWNPPTEFATEAPPTEEDRTLLQAAEVASRAVFEASASLGSDLIPVLADVATGLALVAGTKKPEIIATADELIRVGREELDQSRDGGDDATASPSAPGGADADAGTNDSGSQVPKGRAEMFNAILNQSRAAAYGYERLAVNFDSKSRERKTALARLESLGALSGEMLERLGEDAADAAASAWKLDPTPTDADSAKELALSLEDGVASALLPWLEADASAILRLWESARNRMVFAAPQPLRFAYDEPGQAEVQE